MCGLYHTPIVTEFAMWDKLSFEHLFPCWEVKLTSALAESSMLTTKLLFGANVLDCGKMLVKNHLNYVALLSFSKSVSRQRSEKVVQSQNSLRVPSSAKNLPALDEKVILLSSKAARLNQVSSQVDDFM